MFENFLCFCERWKRSHDNRSISGTEKCLEIPHRNFAISRVCWAHDDRCRRRFFATHDRSSQASSGMKSRAMRNVSADSMSKKFKIFNIIESNEACVGCYITIYER